MLMITGVVAGDRSWPEVVPLDVAVGIDFHADRAFFQTHIFTPEGKIAYTLTCRGITEAYLDQFTDQEGINYIGPWMCLMNEGIEEREVNFFGPPNLKPWMGRNVFMRQAFLPPCVKDPYYGKHREFLFRGMKIVLAFDAIDIQDGKLGYGIFHVQVMPERRATRAFGDKRLPLPQIKDCKGF